jgi:DNA invertase Pin-like site-specific DNA recombinase
MRCKLVGYIRVSTDKQGQSGLGQEAQEAAIQAHVAQTGCQLLAIYTEVESGKRSDRPELARAMAHAKRSKAKLVIAKLDRLTRNVHFLSGLMEAGVDFVACDNPHANRLTVHILAAVAEAEARMISDRTIAALAAYKARGGTLGGQRENTRPLTLADRRKGAAKAGRVAKAHADDAYSDLVPWLREMRDAGMSLRAIAEKLTQEGHTTRTGKLWNQVQVKRVLERA